MKVSSPSPRRWLILQCTCSTLTPDSLLGDIPTQVFTPRTSLSSCCHPRRAPSIRLAQVASACKKTWGQKGLGSNSRNFSAGGSESKTGISTWISFTCYNRRGRLLRVPNHHGFLSTQPVPLRKHSNSMSDPCLLFTPSRLAGIILQLAHGSGNRKYGIIYRKRS